MIGIWGAGGEGPWHGGQRFNVQPTYNLSLTFEPKSGIAASVATAIAVWLLPFPAHLVSRTSRLEMRVFVDFLSLSPAQAPPTTFARLAGRALAPIRNHLCCLVVNFRILCRTLRFERKVFFVVVVSYCGPDFRSKVWTFSQPGAGKNTQ